MTTFGQYLVDDLLPSDMKSDGAMTKKELYNRIYTMAKRDPLDAAERIDKLRRLGHEIATSEGMTVGLDDITPDPRKRGIVKPIMEKIKKVTDFDKRRELILEAETALLKLTKDHPGSMGEQLRSGGRGQPIQLLRTVNAQVHGLDPVTNTAYPWFIPHGYSEGLKPSEMWVANTEARTNLVNSRVAVVEPGALSKVLVNNMNDKLILDEDCGAFNGIMMDTDDPNLADRYLARGDAGLSRNTLITPHVLSALRKKGGQVMVRSPMTCELNDGICQKCYGLNEHGQLHRIGTNVGVRAAQALAEPITQFVISARHGVRGTSADKKKVEGMVGISQMLEMPASFINKATLSPMDGKVTKVEHAPQGGFHVTVGDTETYVPAGLSPVVEPGQTVRAGDALSDGIPRPDEVVQHKGLGAGRKYMVDRLHDVYKDRGQDMDKRHFEILARSHLNYVQIDRDPEERFVPGEIVNYTTLLKSLSEDSESVTPDEAVGRMLAQGHIHHAAGTIVTQEIADELKKNKVKDIFVSAKPPEVTFITRPLSRNPTMNADWMARLGHRWLRESILEGVHLGQVSDVHGAHPAPAYAYGKEFGKGPGGKY